MFHSNLGNGFESEVYQAFMDYILEIKNFFFITLTPCGRRGRTLIIGMNILC